VDLHAAELEVQQSLSPTSASLWFGWWVNVAIANFDAPCLCSKNGTRGAAVGPTIDHPRWRSRSAQRAKALGPARLSAPRTTPDAT
jgi:hypothetical protein